ncbi:MAG TPA: VCBS repeat-containing protein [Terriglobia bacterium]|nr:VCBS repeat-containing protein [Terriglobia bacterium]
MRKGCLSLLLLVAVSLFTAPAFASSHNTVAMHLLRPGVAAVADLDGDHIPDIASGISTGQTSEGYSYRVDLDFSGNPQAKTLSVFSNDSTGLNIEAVDVDGDHDLDLIITGRLSQPIGVWLNDGRGRFTPGDLANYVLSAWQTRPAVQSPVYAVPVVLHFEWRRPQIAGNRQRVDFRPAHFLFREVRYSCLGLSHISIGSARFRAPPVLSV